MKFGVQKEQPFDESLSQHPNRLDSDFDTIDPTDMGSMTRLLDRFDSISIRSWSLSPHGTRMRFPEHLLYGESAQNALPVAMIVYSRKLDMSKPYVLRTSSGFSNGISNNAPHIPNPELDRSRYTVQSLASIEQFLN